MKRIDWDELAEIEDGYHQTFYNTDLSTVYVSGEGGEPVEAFIIGEAPGAQEETQRRPFVGPAGVAIRDLMVIAGLYSAFTPEGGEPNCWLTNTVKFRPPKNRKPFPAEIREARPWIRREWMAVGRPIVIVPVGGVALTAITGKPQSILVAAGKLHKYRSREGLDLCIWPMVHPSYGIRGGKAVQDVLEKDWERFAEWMQKARKHGWLVKKSH